MLFVAGGEKGEEDSKEAACRYKAVSQANRPDGNPIHPHVIFPQCPVLPGSQVDGAPYSHLHVMSCRFVLGVLANSAFGLSRACQEF